MDYLTQHGFTAAVEYLNSIPKTGGGAEYKGSSKDSASNRTEFGTIVNGILDEMSEADRIASLLVVDSDLEGSTGLKGIRTAHPEVCINGGVQEPRQLLRPRPVSASRRANKASSAPSPPSSK